MRQLRESYQIDRSRVLAKDVDSEMSALHAGRWQYPFTVYNWRALTRAQAALRQQGVRLKIWTELGASRIVCELRKKRESGR